tara:strand:+ start:6974 stop:7588 length:615 start_codon:yes stop_codon:yes gene_type:complete
MTVKHINAKIGLLKKETVNMIIFINFLTMTRIFLAAIIFMLLMSPDGYLLSLILFSFAGITDYFDGYLARKYNAVSQLGEILDPIADKILILFLLFGLAINLTSYLIGFIGALIITREIWVGALRDMNARNGKSSATKVTFLAKTKTTIQLFTIFIYLLGLTLNNMLLIIIGDIFLFISLFITLYTGLIYTLNSFKTDELIKER